MPMVCLGGGGGGMLMLQIIIDRCIIPRTWGSSYNIKYISIIQSIKCYGLVNHILWFISLQSIYFKNRNSKTMNQLFLVTKDCEEHGGR